MSLIQELKRRNVFRVALAYTIVAWLVMQVGDTMGPALHLPEWVPSLLAFLLILGFPIAVFFAWTFELTSDGLQLDSEVKQQSAERARSDRKLNGVIFFLLTLALVYFMADRFVFTQTHPASPSVDITQQSEPEPGITGGAVQNSIAVLPFVNMSSDTEQEYFSDGLTEELLNLLVGIKELKVAARTSSFYYKDKLDSVPLLEIAKQLEVTHVLEGSVRKSGDTIRITVQLIKTDDGFHLWSETYDRELDDIFALQDEIAAAVTGSLKVTLLGEAPKTKKLDAKSFEMALQGRFLFNRRSQGDLQRALELFQGAVELDSSNSLAWVGMVPLYLWLFDPPRISDARTAAESALRHDPVNPEAHVRMASVLFQEGRDAEGQNSIRQALILDPENPLVLSIIAGWMDYLGEPDQAISYQGRAIAVDPLHVINLSNMANFLIHANRLDEAEIYSGKAMELAPQSPVGIEALGTIRLLQGRAEEALELALMLGKDRAGVDYVDRKPFIQTAAYYSLGDFEQSNQYLDIFRQGFGEHYPLDMAYLYAWRGEPDLAFDWIDHAFEQDVAVPKKFSQGISRALLTNPFLLSLHEDPRWDDVVAYWPEEEIAEKVSLFK